MLRPVKLWECSQPPHVLHVHPDATRSSLRILSVCITACKSVHLSGLTVSMCDGVIRTQYNLSVNAARTRPAVDASVHTQLFIRSPLTFQAVSSYVSDSFLICPCSYHDLTRQVVCMLQISTHIKQSVIFQKRLTASGTLVYSPNLCTSILTLSITNFQVERFCLQGYRSSLLFYQ